jgi:8-oxo-dGTP diphosphatase
MQEPRPELGPYWVCRSLFALSIVFLHFDFCFLLYHSGMAQKGTYVYDWPRPMVTVDALVFAVRGGKPHVLLINRGGEPFKGLWAVPGGFVDMDEELLTAAERELAEETGLTGVKLEQMHTFGTVGRDPRGRQITVCFLGITGQDNMDVRGGDDASEARWWPVDELPEPLAFDHDAVVAMGMHRIADRLA